ncbi:MAG: porin, partial [Nonlabens sp.]
MKNTVYLLFILVTGSIAQAQLSISSGEHNLEISARLSTYYNQRFLNPGEEERDKNRFKLRDAQLIIEGRIKNDWEYEVQVDFADIGANSSTDIDPANPGLMDAFVTYKGFDPFNIKVGYSKLPYSRSSLTPFPYSTYWQRAQVVRGDIFSRRDVGITLYKDLWKKRINAYAGMYTGLGEASISGDNDASGNPEFIGRVDLSYPAPMKYRQVDYVHTPIPLFSIGVNGRYSNKNLPEGEVFPEGATGEYGLKLIDGKKYTYGMDLTFQYMGFSGQFEIHQVNAQPQNENDPLFLGLTPEQTDGKVLAGGY